MLCQRLLIVGLFVVALFCAATLQADPLKPDECWSITTSAGATTPHGGGVDWRVGWESGIDVGYYWIGCRRSAFRFGLNVAGNASQYHGNARKYTRGDIMFGVRLNARVGPLYLGGRLNFALRITRDGNHTGDFSDRFQQKITRYLNLGFNVGPELFWPFLDWLSLYLNVDYLFSDDPLGSDEYNQHRGQPMHAFTVRLGLVFKL